MKIGFYPFFSTIPSKKLLKRRKREMAVVEGYVVDGDTGEPVVFAVIQVRDQSKRNIVTTGSSDEKGEFTIANVPEGQRYYVCCFSQIYQPVCFQLGDPETGEWIPLPEAGMRVRIETIKVTLAPTVE